MKKLMIAVAGALFVAGYAQAGSGCCPWSAKKGAAEQAAKAEAKADLAGCSMECLDALELSAEQMEQIKLTKAECDAMSCSESAMKKMSSQLAKILTAEQLQQAKDYCAKECSAKEEA